MHVLSYSMCGAHPEFTVVDPGGFQGFHGNPLLKFIYSNRVAVRSRLSNRAVGLRCSNYSSFIRNHPVINVKSYRERSMKVDDLFFGLQLKLS